MRGPVGSTVRTTDGLAGSFRTFHGFQYVGGATGGKVEIRDGAAGGALLAAASVAANGISELEFVERGIATAGGIWVEFTGTADGSVVVFGT